ncbi:MAG: hypothetical protein KC592_14815 [Nitrospira sp.]|nr:hypothetical protein [Nitrospira sp.]HNP27470.1 hypothetical protein [Nitrospirales bacterium]
MNVFSKNQTGVILADGQKNAAGFSLKNQGVLQGQRRTDNFAAVKELTEGSEPQAG